jgi:hypothetical protein
MVKAIAAATAVASVTNRVAVRLRLTRLPYRGPPL